MARTTLPLFPLRTVLFPEGPLPLRVFEPRYLDMVSCCVREQSAFGVVLLLAGSETGTVVHTASFGTMARIIDWYQGSDGILGITAVGTERFELLGIEQRGDGLHIGAVRPVATEQAMALPARYRPMVELLEVILDDLGKLYGEVPRRFDDATWVGCRFAEILPMPLEQKQYCLELTDPVARLEFVRPMLRLVRWETMQ
jgi:Lon protease-like protein